MYFYGMLNTCSLFFVISVSLLAAITMGCSQHEDSEFPEITVMMPVIHSVFENGDTIEFRALISDNQHIAGVNIQLVDIDNKPVLGAISSSPVTNPFIFEGEYIINDPLLPGGMYHLRFQSSDGVNITNRFVQVQVQEMDRQMLYPVIVAKSPGNIWKAYRLPETAIWKEFASHTGDYCGSGINSETSQFYFCGKYLSDLDAVKLPDGIPAWKVKPGFNGSQRWFESVAFYSPHLYVSCFEGNIRGYDKYGIEIYKSESFADAYPYLLVAAKNLLLGAFRDDFSTNRYLAAFHKQGGKLIYSKFIRKDVTGLMHTTGDKVLVFSNSDGYGDISLYNGADNTLYPLRSFTEGTFHEAVAMDGDTYYISTSAGIYRYQAGKNTLTAFETNSRNSEIACDPIARQIYSCKGNTLGVFSTPSAELVKSFLLPDGVIDIYLLFNK